MNNKPEFKEILIENLRRGIYQPRRQFLIEDLADLAESIKSSGVIQPIIVRPLSGTLYEIVAGERRWRAAQMAGLKSVPCLVNHYSDAQTAAITTIENINRVDLNPIEEAHAYQRMIEEFDYQHEELAAIVGKSRAKISNLLRLLKLDDRVQKMLILGTLSEGHGKIIAGLPLQYQYQLAEKCSSLGWSVRRIENEVKKHLDKTTNNTLTNPNIKSLENALSHYIGCQVHIDFDERQCKLHMDCHNLDIFQGVLEKIGFKFESGAC